MIDLLPNRKHELPSGDEQTLREHLASCPACHSAAEDIAVWDQKLLKLMTHVPVPAGFRDQLLTHLVMSTPLPSASKSGRRRWTRKKSGWLAISLGLFAAISLWFVQTARLSLATFEYAAARELHNHPDTELSVFDHSFTAEITDSKWQKVCQIPPMGLNVDNNRGHDLAAFRVNVPALRFRGWLVVVPISKVMDVPPSTYPDTVRYAQMAAWHDSRYVYLCLAEQGSLETLISQWNSAAA